MATMVEVYLGCEIYRYDPGEAVAGDESTYSSPCISGYFFKKRPVKKRICTGQGGAWNSTTRVCSLEITMPVDRVSEYTGLPITEPVVVSDPVDREFAFTRLPVVEPIVVSDPVDREFEILAAPLGEAAAKVAAATQTADLIRAAELEYQATTTAAAAKAADEAELQRQEEELVYLKTAPLEAAEKLAEQERIRLAREAAVKAEVERQQALLQDLDKVPPDYFEPWVYEAPPMIQPWTPPAAPPVAIAPPLVEDLDPRVDTGLRRLLFLGVLASIFKALASER